MKRKQCYIVRTWGAAVLRPYGIAAVDAGRSRIGG
jgi:hypothetical protein